MKFGLSLPNHGDYGNIHRIVELAVLAEESGWGGFFSGITLLGELRSKLIPGLQ